MAPNRPKDGSKARSSSSYTNGVPTPTQTPKKAYNVQIQESVEPEQPGPSRQYGFGFTEAHDSDGVDSPTEEEDHDEDEDYDEDENYDEDEDSPDPQDTEPSSFHDCDEDPIELRTNLEADSDHAQLLDKIDKLRELGVNKYLSLPQLVCVGDQSSGKSSVIEGITGLPLPRAPGLCTRFATQITLRHHTTPQDVRISIKRSLIDRSNMTRQETDDFASFARTMPESELKMSVIEKIYEDASRIMGVPYSKGGTSERQTTNSFSKDLLCIELGGPRHPGLTLLDLPGLIRTATENQSSEDIKLIKDITLNYLKDPGSIILAVLAANIDVANQAILQHASVYDPKGNRTLGIITKPDLVGPGDEAQVLRTAQNITKPLRLGYFVLRNRPTNETNDNTSIQSRDNAESEFFKRQIWSRLPRDRVGVHKLKARLNVLLNEHIRKELPALRSEIQSKIDECQRSLQQIGESRESESDQRTYLMHIAMQTSSLCGQAFEGRYQNSNFSKHPELKLRMRARELNCELAGDFARYGNSRPFVKSAPALAVFKAEEGQGGKFFEDGTFEAATNKQATYKWIEEIHNQSRGVELATSSNSQALPTLFKDLTQSWEALCTDYLHKAQEVVFSFHEKLMDISCHDTNVRERLDEALSDKINEAFDIARQDVRELLNDERGSWLYTESQHLSGLMDQLKQARLQKSVESMSVEGCINPNLTASDQVKRIKQAIMTQTVTHDGTSPVVADLHDQLRCYYLIARRRIVDNMVVQVLERRIMRPLSVIYAPTWIAGLDKDQLCALASEESDILHLRQELKVELQSLTHARNTLL